MNKVNRYKERSNENEKRPGGKGGEE